MARWNLNDLKVPLEKLPVITYMELPPGSKAVDLANLCRRLIAEFQYVSNTTMGNLVEVFKEPAGFASARTLELLDHDLKHRTKMKLITPAMVNFVKQLDLTRYKMVFQAPLKREGSDCCRVTAKMFMGRQDGTKPNLKPEELLAIYWRLRMRFSCDLFSMVLGEIVEDLRKLKYKGFLLPNGKVVPFESMYQIHFMIVPKELHLIDYYPPEDMRDSCTFNFADFPVVIEDLAAFDPINGHEHIKHIALAFNLPEKDEGLPGKLMIIDPTCAQFGMNGVNREILYWGAFEDFVKTLPVKEVTVEGIKDYDYMEPYPEYYHDGPLLIKGTLASFNSESCGYCGDSPLGKLRGKRIRK